MNSEKNKIYILLLPQLFMLETSVEKELHERLTEFAKKHQQIQAIFKGTSPEGCGIDNYHFLTGEDSKYDEKLSDEVTNLDLDLANNFLPETEFISLDVWPIEPEDAPDYFSGESIHKKQS